MGNDSISGLSPGYRRGTIPLSPSPFKRSLSSPESSWRSLLNRHKFLLYMLGLLTLLCTIYLYFAITLGPSDSCSGLGGTQRIRCQIQVNSAKADSMKAHHRRLLHVEVSDSSEKNTHKGIVKGDSLEEFIAFFQNLKKELKKEPSRTTETPVNYGWVDVNGEPWSGDIATLKASLDAEMKKMKGNQKTPKATRLRGDF